MKTIFKILFYVSYVFLIIWFYKVTLKPESIRIYKAVFNIKDSVKTVTLPLTGDTIKKVEPAIAVTKHKDIIKHVTINNTNTIVSTREDSLKLKTLQNLFTNGSGDYEKSSFVDTVFNNHVNALALFLFNRFSLKQLKSINTIYLINWSDLNDNVTGLCSNLGAVNTIYLPMNNDVNQISLLHEIWHSIYFSNIDLFNAHLTEWNNCNSYITEYAQTDIKEDIAETGSYFSNYDYRKNPKFEIIKKIYEQTL